MTLATTIKVRGEGNPIHPAIHALKSKQIGRLCSRYPYTPSLSFEGYWGVLIIVPVPHTHLCNLFA